MDDMTKHRILFPILNHKVHLGSCSQSPQSTPTLQAMEEYLENWRTVGMDWGFWMDGVERAKVAFARLINADADEVAIVSSVSDAASTIASCFPFGDKNEVITTVDDFPTIGHVWLAHAEKNHLKVHFAQSKNGFYTPSDFEEYVSRKTALLSVHHVSYANGTKQDISALAEYAQANGIWLFVDAYQSMGTCPIDVKKMSVDMLASGNLKYLLGIPGIAFLYVSRRVAEQIEPSSTGWFGRVNPFAFEPTELDFAPGAQRFNAGTPPVLAAFAARGGVEYLQDIGLECIERRISSLSQHAIESIVKRGLVLLSPKDVTKKGSTTAIAVPDAHAMEQALASQNIIVSARGEAIRIAPHFFNTEEEIDIALDAIEKELEKSPYRGNRYTSVQQ